MGYHRRGTMTDSRQFVPELLATLDHLEHDRVQLSAPSPGLWRNPPDSGALVRPGDVLGELEILGVLHRLRAPEGAFGVVVGERHGLARRPVDHGAALLVLDASMALGESARGHAIASEPVGASGQLQFCSPSSGRFYQRPGPDRPTFVEVGQIIERGQTIGLLEVMKTFTRINYDDPKLPARAKVVALVAADQADIARGEVILRLEPA
jgi:acetyl-CoA carboxylase biotin carboxyl carrier protein